MRDFALPVPILIVDPEIKEIKWKEANVSIYCPLAMEKVAQAVLHDLAHGLVKTNDIVTTIKAQYGFFKALQKDDGKDYAMSDKPKLTEAEIDALAGEALRRAMFDCVHDWGEITTLWHPESSLDDVRDVEAEIERRGLKSLYCEFLTQPFVETRLQVGVSWFAVEGAIFATPEARCRAALKAVMR